MESTVKGKQLTVAIAEEYLNCDPKDGFAGGSDGKESTCNAGDLGSIPGFGKPLGGGHGNLLQYS